MPLSAVVRRRGVRSAQGFSWRELRLHPEFRVAWLYQFHQANPIGGSCLDGLIFHSVATSAKPSRVVNLDKRLDKSLDEPHSEIWSSTGTRPNARRTSLNAAS